MPLLAVARELKRQNPDVTVVGVCEKGCKFVDLFLKDENIDRTFMVRAGKYRRYGGRPWWQRITDVRTLLLNIRDVFRTMAGYREAVKLLKDLQADGMLVKGGFVAVPMGLAAARLNIPYITHDSDSVPGLANRIISRWADVHATGLPAELYAYPHEKTVYTGIPLSPEFKKVSPPLRVAYREKLGLSGCTLVISVTGGSQGAEQLNKDMIAIVPRLMKEFKQLGIAHITGRAHEQQARSAYDQQLMKDDRKRVVVRGFVHDLYVYSGAADVVVSRAGASAVAELSVQGLPVVVVPGLLAGNHQEKNANHLAAQGAVVKVPYGDSEALYQALSGLLANRPQRTALARKLHKLSRSNAAKELAELTLSTIGPGN